MKTLYSQPNQHNYHNIPDEWQTQMRHIECDFQEYVSKRADVSAYVACKGGPYVGYRWRGTVRLEFKPETWNLKQRFTPVVRYMYLKRVEMYADEVFVHNIETLRRIWDRVRGKIELIEYGCKVVSLYRNSKLIPRHVIKKHQNIAWLLFAEEDKRGLLKLDYYNDAELQKWLNTRFTKYVVRHSKCPYCDIQRKWQETILGWHCEWCGATLEDVCGTIKWAEPMDGPYKGVDY